MDEATRSSDFKNNPAALLSSAWYLTGDGLGKRVLIRFNVLLLYIFAILKRYTKMTDKVLAKVTSFFR